MLQAYVEPLTVRCPLIDKLVETDSPSWCRDCQFNVEEIEGWGVECSFLEDKLLVYCEAPAGNCGWVMAHPSTIKSHQRYWAGTLNY